MRCESPMALRRRGSPGAWRSERTLRGGTPDGGHRGQLRREGGNGRSGSWSGASWSVVPALLVRSIAAAWRAPEVRRLYVTPGHFVTKSVRPCTRAARTMRRPWSAVRLCAVRRGPPARSSVPRWRRRRRRRRRARQPSAEVPVAAQPPEHGGGVSGRAHRSPRGCPPRRPTRPSARANIAPMGTPAPRDPLPIGVRVAHAPSASARGRPAGTHGSAQSGRRSARSARERARGRAARRRSAAVSRGRGRGGVLRRVGVGAIDQHARAVMRRGCRRRVSPVSRRGARGGAVGTRQGSAHVVTSQRASPAGPPGRAHAARAQAEWSPCICTSAPCGSSCSASPSLDAVGARGGPPAASARWEPHNVGPPRGGVPYACPVRRRGTRRTPRPAAQTAEARSRRHLASVRVARPLRQRGGDRMRRA